MYDWMKEHNIKTDEKKEKLMQMLETDGYTVMYYYYLWFLMDTCEFEIEDMEVMHIFSYHDSFHEFATKTMTRRQAAILSKATVGDTFNKIVLNGYYCYDIKDEANYSKMKIPNRHGAFLLQFNSKFRFTEELTPDIYEDGELIQEAQYLVEVGTLKYDCKTCLREGVATLDISKVIYLNIIYNFMYKCLDMNKLHFIEGDTDSAYWAVAGNGNPGFQDVITDMDFYLAHVSDYFPLNFYGVRASLDLKGIKYAEWSPLEKQQFNKRLGGAAIEKESQNMIALASKLYTIWNVMEEASKAKGVHEKLSRFLYIDVFNNGTIVKAINRLLRKHGGDMSRIEVTKQGITPIYTKYTMDDDRSFCYPLFLTIARLIAEDYETA
jgi:hypothetical protein